MGVVVKSPRLLALAHTLLEKVLKLEVTMKEIEEIKSSKVKTTETIIGESRQLMCYCGNKSYTFARESRQDYFVRKCADCANESKRKWRRCQGVVVLFLYSTRNVFVGKEKDKPVGCQEPSCESEVKTPLRYWQFQSGRFLAVCNSCCK